MEGKQLVMSNDGEGSMQQTQLRILHQEEGVNVSHNGCNIHNPSGMTIMVNITRNRLITLQFLLAILLYLPYLTVI